MIKIEINKPKFIPFVPPKDNFASKILTWMPKGHQQKSGLIGIEVVRRQSIVATLAEQFYSKFSIGDSVVFRSEKQLGPFLVAHCVKKYENLGTDPWPDNDMPLIVALFDDKTKKTYHCTINAIEKVK